MGRTGIVEGWGGRGSTHWEGAGDGCPAAQAGSSVLGSERSGLEGNTMLEVLHKNLDKVSPCLSCG